MCMSVLIRSGMGKHIGVGFWLACFVVLGIAKASVNGTGGGKDSHVFCEYILFTAGESGKPNSFNTMKKQLFYASMLLTALCLGACNGNTPEVPEEKPGEPAKDSMIVCTPETYETWAGTAVEFEVRVTSERAWQATAKGQNITVTPAQGEGETVVSVKAGAAGKAETAEVVFDNGKKQAVVTIVWKEQEPVSKAFKVSASGQVFFAPGNLQYQASTQTWRFAEHQYDVMGSENEKYPGGQNMDASGNIVDFYEDPTVWIDLFGYSTPSTNFGINNGDPALNYHGAFVDWGTNMPAQGDQPWRTLTIEEWEYLLYQRPNAANLKGMVNIKEGEGFMAEENKGVVLLPDDWQCPAGITFVPYAEESEDNSYDDNVYTFAEWEQMEALGAVFLPAAGARKGSGIFTVSGVNSFASYWAASSETEENWANVFAVTMWKMQLNTLVRGTGSPVRLARNAR